ncbi:hypothetical protein [Dietzia psychralcaliphila]|uniref:Uncharacterized protein n=1 Tax=Dietzia psychralcaliphila TaxID=139021 RepID=A0AAD0JVL8_9ACTN|nr:hypothetical protein [Dietzia psychralcaliphila]AWH97519.1 hypothetical protein A6048_15035 [Dietzia psychralcaliphila]PTM89175.1 hypothetical protein C8N39_10216 [Dietzia psychralcaliphila]
MVVFWFLLALALLAAALILLRLDARQRGGSASRETPPAVGAGSVGEEARSDDDDEVPPVAPPAGEVDPDQAERGDESGVPQLAPFQRATDHGATDLGAGELGAENPGVDEPDPGGGADLREEPEIAGMSEDPVVPEAGGVNSGVSDTGGVDPGHVVAGASAPEMSERVAGPDPERTTEPVDPPTDERTTARAAEPTAQSSPRLLDRVRGFLPARRQTGRPPEPAAAPPADPLADSPVVRWLEDREFEPTPTPAPEFRHGDFAGGLSALGTVSHGMFRGRRAIMGVSGGRTVLALRRDTASDVVLDLSRADVDAEPGFHDAGEVASLEARSSDYGRLDLIDRDRLTSAVSEVPAGVRRIWAEGEWVAATIDGVNDPSTWDDVVVALHAAADVLAPFPPIGGRARALPLEIDPGAPGAADGPEADPTVGMDGEVGTGTHGLTAPAATPDPPSGDVLGQQTPVAAPAQATAVEDRGEQSPDEEHFPDEGHSPERTEPRRAGHLRLVPERKSARDLADVPVVADRGDTGDDPGSETGPDPVSAADSEPAGDTVPGIEDLPAKEPVAEEPDPFAEIMEPAGPVPARGDVAADHLAPRPPLSRPTRGAGQAYPEDASVPPLAAGLSTGGSGIKPLGSEDDEDEIRTEVERFDAARIDGGSDLDAGTGGRHAQPAEDETPVWLRPEVTPAPPRAGSGKHRREEPEVEQAPDTGSPAAASDTTASGRERPGVEPDVEQTTRIQMPPDIRD